jgi:hypothetical protein
MTQYFVEDENGKIVLDREAFDAAVEAKFDELVTEAVGDHVASIVEVMDDRVDEKIEDLVSRIDEWSGLMIESTREELIKLMTVAVQELGGEAKRKAFINKVAALVRSGALSSLSGDFGQGTDDKSKENRDRVHGRANEDLANEGRRVFEETTSMLTEDQKDKLMKSVENAEYHSVPELQNILSEAMVRTFPAVAEKARVTGYASALDRILPKTAE